MMPNMDGIEATMKIRKEKNIPIIMLTAKSKYSDKILGLNIGADDYITKPFYPLELIARVKSQLIRYINLGNFKNEEDVEIIFKNISKYYIDVNVNTIGKRFVQGDKSRNIEGHGLGLSIIKSLVNIQGGKVELYIQ